MKTIPANLHGSAAAVKKVKELISAWSEKREGCLEVFAEWAMTHPGATLDDGLNEMVRIGLLNDWPTARIDCGSGHHYGICPKCRRGHGFVVFRRKENA